MRTAISRLHPDGSEERKEVFIGGYAQLVARLRDLASIECKKEIPRVVERGDFLFTQCDRSNITYRARFKI